eukprot:gene30216-39422_t
MSGFADKSDGSNSGGEIDTLCDPDLKIILLGDSAAGKSKLIERYLMDEFNPRQEYQFTGETKKTLIEAFQKMHPSYYYRAHCCILVFDVTRKVTYQHLSDWYGELRENCPDIPCLLVANKIDVDYNV